MHVVAIEQDFEVCESWTIAWSSVQAALHTHPTAIRPQVPSDKCWYINGAESNSASLEPAKYSPLV